MPIQLVTVVHPLAQVPRDHREDLGPKRPGYTRAPLPADTTEQSAPAAADWLSNPHEQTHQSTLHQLVEGWRIEPRFIDPEGL